MKNINEFLYGDDYRKKMDLFNNKVMEIENKYNGDFDVESGYFTMEPNPINGEVRLTFDVQKKIPTDIQTQIQGVFTEIWKD